MESTILTILLVIVVIVVLVVVHELGHFIAAKLSGVRVDEFGVGFPPRALTLGKIGDTEYTLNWIPLGGFVRMFGEEGYEHEKGSFTAAPLILKMILLVAGIAMNLVFAWILFSATLAIGTLQELTPTQIQTVKDAVIVFDSVRPGTPAAKAGFQAGDEIKSEEILTKAFGESYSGANPAAFTTLISFDTDKSPMKFVVDRNGKILTITATPLVGIVTGAPTRPGLGVVVSAVGTVRTPIGQAPYQGIILTWNVVKETGIALGQFFTSLVTFKANFSEVTGPIGIANALGQASANGLSALLSLIALISVNLALVNILPIPGLDGGRLLFVIIEAIIRRPFNQKIAERVNWFFFVLLILLVIVISVHDAYVLHWI